MINQTPDGKYTEEAYFRAAKTYFIQGRYQEAIEFYQKFLSKYPEGKLVHDVRFAIANCLEEQENLQEALQMYKKIENNYPNRDVIAKKIAALEKGCQNPTDFTFSILQHLYYQQTQSLY